MSDDALHRAYAKFLAGNYAPDVPTGREFSRILREELLDELHYLDLAVTRFSEHYDREPDGADADDCEELCRLARSEWLMANADTLTDPIVEHFMEHAAQLFAEHLGREPGDDDREAVADIARRMWEHGGKRFVRKLVEGE